MADRKFSAAPILSGDSLSDVDTFWVLDKSDTTDGPGGTVKQLPASRVADFSSLTASVNYITLAGIDTTQSVFQYIADAINAAGPFECDAGEMFVFFTIQGGAASEPGGGALVYSYYMVFTGYLEIGGGVSEFEVQADEIIFLGTRTVTPDNSPDLFIDLGEITSPDTVEDEFNLGNPSPPGPWDCESEKFVVCELDAADKIYRFIGDPGLYGPGFLSADSADFQDLAAEGQAPSSEFLDTTFRIVRGSNPSAKLEFDLSALGDSVTRKIIMPNADVDLSSLGGSGVFQGNYDADANSPDLEGGSGVIKGQKWVVSVAGDFFTEAVQVGDNLEAKVDDPSSLSDWVVTNKNIEDTELLLRDGSVPMTGPIKLSSGSISSASTLNISGAAGNWLIVTGTTDISAMSGGTQAGEFYFLTFASSLELQHSGTFFLPDGQNITVLPGDTLLFQYAGGSAWKCILYITEGGSVFGSKPLKVADTTDTLPMRYTRGRISNESAPNATTEYKYEHFIFGAWEQVRINAASEPTLQSDFTLAATGLLSGYKCKIASAGTTDFTAIGAPDNNVGTVFTATGAGTGTGTVYRMATKIKGDVFVADTDMYMEVRNPSGDLPQYKFVAITLNQDIRTQNVSSLKNLVDTEIGDVVVTDSYSSGSKGGARYIKVDPTGLTSNDHDVIEALDGSFYEIDINQDLDLHMFGAVGDGSTADTDAITAAFDYIERKQGGLINIPDGVFAVEGVSAGKSLVIESNTYPITLKGNGEKQSVFKLTSLNSNAQVRVLSLIEAVNVTIEDVGFDGNWTTFGDDVGQQAGIFISDCSDIDINRVRCLDTEGDAITVRTNSTPGQNIKIRNSYFDYNYRNGITIGGDASGQKNLQIDNCYFGANIDTQQIDCEPNVDNCFSGIGISRCYFAEMADASDKFSLVLTYVDNVVLFNNEFNNPVLIRNCDNVRSFGCDYNNGLNTTNLCLEIDREVNDVEFYGDTFNSDSGNVCVQLGQVSSLRPDNIKFNGCKIISDAEIFKVTSCNGVLLNNCHLETSDDTVYAIDIYAFAENLERFKMLDCHVVGGNYPVRLRIASTHVLNRVNISDCDFEGFDGNDAIYINSTSVKICTNMVCKGNTVPSGKNTTRNNHASDLLIGGSLGKSGAIWSVKGTPESALTGYIGDMAIRRDGGASTTLYIKESGAGTNTGWVAK